MGHQSYASEILLVFHRRTATCWLACDVEKLTPIPQEWIRDYIDQLLKVAGMYPDGLMKAAVALRAEHAMDLVKAFRDAKKD